MWRCPPTSLHDGEHVEARYHHVLRGTDAHRVTRKLVCNRFGQAGASGDPFYNSSDRAGLKRMPRGTSEMEPLKDRPFGNPCCLQPLTQALDGRGGEMRDAAITSVVRFRPRDEDAGGVVCTPADVLEPHRGDRSPHSTAIRPIVAGLSSTVVSAGWKAAASSVPPMPTTPTSRPDSMPLAWSAFIAPKATRSLK